MAEPRHKVKEIHKKTIIDKLKQSAIFILFLILLAITCIISFVVWLSGLLSSRLEGDEIFKDKAFFLFVGIGAGLVIFLALAWFIQRQAHGPQA